MTTAVFTPPCAKSPDLFFSTAPAEIDRARTICFGCPARSGCLREALATQQPCGVWGGELFSDGGVVPCGRMPGGVPPGMDTFGPEARAKGSAAGNAKRAADRDSRLNTYARCLASGLSPEEAAIQVGVTSRTRERYDRKLFEAAA